MSLETQDLVDAVKKYPLIFVAGALGVVFAAVIYFRFGLLAEQEGLLQQKQDELKKYERNIANGNMLSKQIAELKAVNQQVLLNAPNPSRLASNLKVFYQIESDLGVKIIDLQQLQQASPAKGAAKSTYSTLGFRVSMSGDYLKTFEFIRKLEQSYSVSRITAASISRTGDPSGPTRLLSLNIEVLAQNP